jgi:hypothetical protein
MTEPIMIETTYLPSARLLALAAFVSLVLFVVTFAVAHGVWWAEYPGVLFHLSIFFLVPWLPAPAWAKAAGYGRLIIDTTVGAMAPPSLLLEPTPTSRVRCVQPGRIASDSSQTSPETFLTGDVR